MIRYLCLSATSDVNDSGGDRGFRSTERVVRKLAAQSRFLLTILFALTMSATPNDGSLGPRLLEERHMAARMPVPGPAMEQDYASPVGASRTDRSVVSCA